MSIDVQGRSLSHDRRDEATDADRIREVCEDNAAISWTHVSDPRATLLHRAEQRTDRAGDTHRQGTPYQHTRRAAQDGCPAHPRRERAKRGEEDERDDRDDENRLLRRKDAG